MLYDSFWSYKPLPMCKGDNLESHIDQLRVTLVDVPNIIIALKTIGRVIPDPDFKDVAFPINVPNQNVCVPIVVMAW